nr:short-chain dehydrogenase [uncultured bacterium]
MSACYLLNFDAVIPSEVEGSAFCREGQKQIFTSLGMII